MTVSMAGFTINDAVTKAVVDEMNIGQLVLVRGLFAAMLMGLFAWQQGALRSLRDLAHPVIAFRTFCEAAATLCFITALSRLPLATVSAILQALPLVVTMGAALFFSEPVGWRRWAAIFVGLIGVLVILRPGFEGFNAFTLLAPWRFRPHGISSHGLCRNASPRRLFRWRPRSPFRSWARPW
jgi:drug/metabolite transporter (DMT)-like permease